MGEGVGATGKWRWYGRGMEKKGNVGKMGRGEGSNKVTFWEIKSWKTCTLYSGGDIYPKLYIQHKVQKAKGETISNFLKKMKDPDPLMGA